MKARAILYACLCVVIAVFLLGPGKPFIAYGRVGYGMTATQVEARLDSNGSGPTWRWAHPGHGWIETWQYPTADIIVAYDTDGRVIEKRVRLWNQLFELLGWCRVMERGRDG